MIKEDGPYNPSWVSTPHSSRVRSRAENIFPFQHTYIWLSTHSSHYNTQQVAAGKQLFKANCGILSLPAPGLGLHSLHCTPALWKEEGSATTALSHQWHWSLGGLCFDQWSCSNHRTDPELGGGSNSSIRSHRSHQIAVTEVWALQPQANKSTGMSL